MHSCSKLFSCIFEFQIFFFKRRHQHNKLKKKKLTGKSSKPKMSRMLIDVERSPLLTILLTRFTSHPNSELRKQSFVDSVDYGFVEEKKKMIRCRTEQNSCYTCKGPWLWHLLRQVPDRCSKACGVFHCAPPAIYFFFFGFVSNFNGRAQKKKRKKRHHCWRVGT